MQQAAHLEVGAPRLAADVRRQHCRGAAARRSAIIRRSLAASLPARLLAGGRVRTLPAGRLSARSSCRRSGVHRGPPGWWRGGRDGTPPTGRLCGGKGEQQRHPVTGPILHQLRWRLGERLRTGEAIK